jgi:hypothetical protein
MALEKRILNLASAEVFVSNTKNVRWEGWDILTFIPKPYAYMSKNGVYDRDSGRWGIETRVSPDSKGNYKVLVSKYRGRK